MQIAKSKLPISHRLPLGPYRIRLVVVGVIFLIGSGVVLCLTDRWGGWTPKAPQESFRYHWEGANLASDSGNVALAKSHLGVVLAKFPLNPQAHFLRARTCRGANDPAARQNLM